MGKRIDFSEKSFDDLIERHGYEMELQHAIRCPCLDSSTGQPDPNCLYCTNGYQYYGAETIQAMCMNISVEKQFSETGGFLLGSMMVTVLAETNLGYHDRLVNRNSVMQFSQLIERDEDTTVDKARFAIVEVFRVVGKNGVIYQPDTNYTLTDDGEINWVADGPTAGDYYSIAYKMHPSWLCLQAPHSMRDTQIKFQQPSAVHHRLPLQCLARMEYLVED